MDEKTMINSGKPEVCLIMKGLTKDIIGTSWDLETCKFAYELVIEAMKRSIEINGRLCIENFCVFELSWEKEKSIYDPYMHDGEFNKIPEHNIIRVRPTKTYKDNIRKIKSKFIKSEIRVRKDKIKKEE